MVAIGTNGWNTEPLGGIMDFQENIDAPKTKPPDVMKQPDSTRPEQAQVDRSIIEVQNDLHAVVDPRLARVVLENLVVPLMHQHDRRNDDDQAKFLVFGVLHELGDE